MSPFLTHGVVRKCSKNMTKLFYKLKSGFLHKSLLHLYGLVLYKSNKTLKAQELGINAKGMVPWTGDTSRPELGQKDFILVHYS